MKVQHASVTFKDNLKSVTFRDDLKSVTYKNDLSKTSKENTLTSSRQPPLFFSLLFAFVLFGHLFFVLFGTDGFGSGCPSASLVFWRYC